MYPLKENNIKDENCQITLFANNCDILLRYFARLNFLNLIVIGFMAHEVVKFFI